MRKWLLEGKEVYPSFPRFVGGENDFAGDPRRLRPNAEIGFTEGNNGNEGKGAFKVVKVCDSAEKQKLPARRQRSPPPDFGSG